jgi:hypothetical protein
MIDIQIFEIERQAGQPVLFKMIISCSSRSTQIAGNLVSGQEDYDLIFTIEARSTIPDNELDSSSEFIQGIFGYDQPCSCLPARPTCWTQGIQAATSLPLAVFEASVAEPA